MAKAILNEGVIQSFPVKGAIVYGEYTWGNLVYGKAVIDAHELESQQTWVGISCANNLPHIETAWGFDSLLCYPAPKKSGSVCLHPVISWDPPEYEQLQSYLSMKGLCSKGEIMSWSWADRVQHTIAFALYKRILVGANGSPNIFRGMLPIQTIDLNMKHA